MRPVLYVVANKGLNMSPGKLAAQVAHATMGIAIKGITKFGIPDLQPWFTEPHRWVIILEGEDEMHLTNIREYLGDRGVNTYAVIDEGVNEIRPFSITALGVQILDKDSPEASYLSGLKKYPADHPEWKRIYNNGWNDAMRHIADKWSGQPWWKRKRVVT